MTTPKDWEQRAKQLAEGCEAAIQQAFEWKERYETLAQTVNKYHGPCYGDCPIEQALHVNGIKIGTPTRVKW